MIAKPNSGSMFKKKLLCYTLSGRKVFYYICYKSKMSKKVHQLKDQKVIVLSARVHPSESNSSYMMKGFLDSLADKGSKASKYLRENFILVIIPMLNPDGVSIGNSRCSLSGYDLNRGWENPDRFVQPEIYYAKKLMNGLQRKNRVVFYCDFHGHSIKENCFMYGCHLEGSRRITREYPSMMYELCNHFDKQSCK